MLIDLYSIVAFIVFCVVSYIVGKLLFEYIFKILFGFWPHK